MRSRTFPCIVERHVDGTGTRGSSGDTGAVDPGQEPTWLRCDTADRFRRLEQTLVIERILVGRLAEEFLIR